MRSINKDEEGGKQGGGGGKNQGSQRGKFKIVSQLKKKKGPNRGRPDGAERRKNPVFLGK